MIFTDGIELLISYLWSNFNRNTGMNDNLNKFIIPVFVVAYGDTEEESVAYVEQALDKTDFVFADGIFSVEVLEDEVFVSDVNESVGGTRG